MRYSSGAAFRRALETRLLEETRTRGMPLIRLRKTLAFDRLLARMLAVSPEN